MASSFLTLLLYSVSLLIQPPSSVSNLLRTAVLFRSQLNDGPTEATDDITPTAYFEVTKPIKLPKTRPCSYQILHHEFGFTYGQPPVLANYTPPSDCPSQNFSKIVLDWTATCKGRQFDRIFGVWLGGVEILRSCTAEPRATGIVWSVQKDITRYYSLLTTNQPLAVYLGNLVDRTYTGVYHVNISIHFYPSENSYHKSNEDLSGYGSGADLIFPISRNLPLNDGLWFEIQNSTHVESKEFKIPQNAYRAVLEVYVSFHENDEFWYGNFPNEYVVVNNLSNTAGNGPFREVLVGLDGMLIGAIWPFTVVYTGGVNPLLWRPITGIGSFDLPSYDIEVTPCLGTILDGKTHQLSFSVTNALNVWYLDANLHVWLDRMSSKVEAKLMSRSALPLQVHSVYNFTGLNGKFMVNASRSITSIGWAKSSYGEIETKSNQEFHYSNFMVIGKDGNMQVVDQVIDFNDTVIIKDPSSSVHSFRSIKRFPFYMVTDNVEQGNNSYLSEANLTLGFNKKNIEDSKSSGSNIISSVENSQNGQGSMLVKGNLVVSGLGSTQQSYHYYGGELCYLRNISSSNYTILYDKVSYNCRKRTSSLSRFGLKKRLHVSARRAAFASNVHSKNGIYNN